MMKTKEELNALKNEVETMDKKLSKLKDEELKQVTGGIGIERRTSFEDENSESIDWEQLIEG